MTLLLVHCFLGALRLLPHLFQLEQQAPDIAILTRCNNGRAVNGHAYLSLSTRLTFVVLGLIVGLHCREQH